MLRKPEAIESIERPLSLCTTQIKWGSDAFAETIRRLGFSFIALTPGASLAGLHDSIVNYLGNKSPQLILSLHEDNAVAIAHGFAKFTEQPMAVAIHGNVGLMNSMMSIYNAWSDRVPILLVGATSGANLSRRRPWMDWVNSGKGQNALTQNFLKWNGDPTSVSTAIESLMRATKITGTSPSGPVYVCINQDLHETPLSNTVQLPDPRRYATPKTAITSDSVHNAAELLKTAKSPLILPGRVSRDLTAWRERIQLAEKLGALVITDNLVGSTFPTNHPLHIGHPDHRLSKQQIKTLKSADVILSLDKIDLAGTLRQAWPDNNVTAKIISCSLDDHTQISWSQIDQPLPPTDIEIEAQPDSAVAALCKSFAEFQGKRTNIKTDLVDRSHTPLSVKNFKGPISMYDLAAYYLKAAAEKPVTLTRLPYRWPAEGYIFKSPLDYLGREGGAGGSAPGIAVGAALAAQWSGSIRLPIAIIGDGEFLMGHSALWSAAHYKIPLMIIVANNRSFKNDAERLHEITLERHRTIENISIGTAIKHPEINLAGIARDHGLGGIGPITDISELPTALEKGFKALSDGKAIVLDIHIDENTNPKLN